MEKTANFGIRIPEILMPDEKINMRKWSVVACDQYTSDVEYWQNVERSVGNGPSTYHIMLPEIYLESKDKDARIGQVKQNMLKYIHDGVLTILPTGFVLTERKIGGKIRKGLMLAIDLEEYDFDIDNKPSIRATEQTLLERIPPRVEIRKDAAIEMPHTMIIMDDKDDAVIGEIYKNKEKLPKLYDFDLMSGGGHIKGYLVENEALIDLAMQGIANLPLHDGMRFCVGDGNHSLATAKTVWEQQKVIIPESERYDHPLRYALVELVNIHDAGIEFLPIHRVLFKANITKCLQYVVDKLNADGAGARLIYTRRKSTQVSGDACHVIPFTSRDSMGRIEITSNRNPLAAQELQPILDEYLKENPSTTIDYIHGDEDLEKLALQYDNLGFSMPAMDKDSFFDTVVKCGVLPRKCFSLGEANEKRYYLESRMIINMEDDKK